MRTYLFLILLLNILAVIVCNTDYSDESSNSYIKENEIETNRTERRIKDRFKERGSRRRKHKTPSCIKVPTSFKPKPLYNTTKRPPLESETLTPFPSCKDGALFDFRDALIEFGSKYFHTILDENIHENAKIVNTCPPAILSLLAILGIYSYGRQSTEIFRALKLRNSDEVRCTMLQFFHLLPKGQNVQFSLSKSSGILFANNQYRFTDQFKQDFKEVVRGSVHNADFGYPQEVISKINYEVQSITNNEIKFVFPYIEEINYKTELVVASGITLKFDWPYCTDEMTTGPFYSSFIELGIENYYTLVGVFNYTYSTEIDSTVVEIELDDVYKEVCYMPDSKLDLKKAIHRLRHPEIFNGVLNSLTPAYLAIKIPQMKKTCTNIPMDKIIKRDADLHRLFHSHNNDVINIVNDNLPFELSSARQEVCVEMGCSKNGLSSNYIDNSKKQTLPAELNFNNPFFCILMTRDRHSTLFPVSTFAKIN